MDNFHIDIGEGPNDSHLTDLNISPKQVWSMEGQYMLNKNQLPILTAYQLRDIEGRLIKVLQELRELLRPYHGRYNHAEDA